MLTALLVGSGSGAFSANWSQGTHYFLIQPAQPKTVAENKVEVTEVFSYACPACNRFYPTIDKLRAALPANAELTFIPAAFNPSEDWPMFQRAYYAAQALGVDKKMHDAVFDAVWKTGELAVIDVSTQRIKSPAPTIEDAARWYAKNAGVKADVFVSTANSFGVDTRIRQADQFIRAAQVEQTPTMIVDGKYRVTVPSAGGDDKLIELVVWLVQQESAGAMKSVSH
jgi:thiol:disulfide interchange protein DsbA